MTAAIDQPIINLPNEEPAGRHGGVLSTRFPPILPVLLLALVVPDVLAQGLQSAADQSCSIEGGVVDAATALPLEGAILTLYPQGETAGESVVSGADGTFHFNGLEPGIYRLSAWHVGYLRKAYSQRGLNRFGVPLKLAPGQDRQNVVFRLLRAAAISGHVFEENGDPVLGASVQAMRFDWSYGQRRLKVEGYASTDDRGAYRVFGLEPGRYYLSATYLRMEAMQLGLGVSPEGFVPTFYPDTTDVGTAVPITLQAGDDVSGYDITLISEHAVSVRGSIPIANDTVNGVSYGQQVWLSRVDGTLRREGSRWSNPDSKDHFVFTSVTPGTYVLQWQPSGPGRKSQEEATQVIQVGDSDIDGINLVPQPELKVAGSVRVEGGAKVNLSRVGIRLIPTGPFPAGYPGARVQSDGTFSVRFLQDGTYRLQVYGLPPNFYLKSARMSGEDIFSTGLSVSRDEPPGTLELVLSPKAGHITGVVVSDGKPFAGGIVALITQKPRQGIRFSYRRSVTDTNGRFAFDRLPPGEYTLCAWEQLPNDFGDPALLPSLKASGKDVQVSEGSRLSVELQLTSSTGSGE